MSVFEKAKGKLKQVAGELKNDPHLTREGRAQEAKGEAAQEAATARAEAKVHEAEEKVHEARQRGAQRAKPE